MRLLVTGGAGFIGSNFVCHALCAADHSVVNLDALTYAGNLANLASVARHPRYVFLRGDITSGEDVERAMDFGIDVVVNFAAESHVDRSILQPLAFVHTNVIGTQVLLEAARRNGVRKFVQISTDEVYGTLGVDDAAFTESTPLAPNSPYAASKAGADLLVRAYHQTYGLPVNITRCSNNYGPHQFPEKLIPLMIAHATADKPLPVYGDGRQIRDWLHVSDHCKAIDLVIAHGRDGEVYNVGGHSERANIEIVRTILRYLGKSESLIRHVADRPGHDRRYAIDAAKIRAELGWQPAYTFETGLQQTLAWYREHPEWWTSMQTGEYRRFVEQQYQARLEDAP